MMRTDVLGLTVNIHSWKKTNLSGEQEMNRNKAIVVFEIESRNESHDIEVPLDITANELVMGLNAAYGLNIDTEDINSCYLKSEHPIALLKGSRTLEEFGIRNGSLIYA